VRQALSHWRGLEDDTAGDSFYATFDGPARAIHCAIEAGECELIDGKCAGFSLSIGARIAARAGKSEVLVSQTVKDLVAGSGLAFDDAGAHDLKRVPGRWSVHRVRSPGA
jgi:class 3 adenylate cyclase